MCEADAAGFLFSLPVLLRWMAREGGRGPPADDFEPKAVIKWTLWVCDSRAWECTTDWETDGSA